LAVAFGLLFTFIVSLVGGLLLHLDLPSARSLVVRELNATLAPQFKGHLAIDRLGRLSIFGIRGVDLTVTAIDGTPVIVAKGVAARIAPLALVKSVLFGKGDLHVGVDSIAIDGLETNLDSEPDGSLKLVHAFDPRTPSPPPKQGARGTAIDLPDVLVRHIWAHGIVAGVPPVDADVDALQVAFLSTPSVTNLDVSRMNLAARGLPRGVTPHGSVGAHLAMPSATGKSMWVSGVFDGGVGEVPLTASLTMDGDALDAVLDVPEASAASVQASLDQAPVYQPVSAHGEAHGDLSNLKTTLRVRLGRGSLDLDGNVVAKGALAGHVTVTARDIDARTFAKDSPATDVGVHVVASAETNADKTLVAHALLEIPVGMAAGQAVPHAALTVDVAQRVEKDGATFTGHIEGIVDEPGAPLAITIDGRSHAGLSNVSFGAKVDVPRLADVKRVAPSLGRGKAQVILSGRAEVGQSITFDAQVDGSIDGFERSGVKVDHVALAATGHGTPTQPEIEARAVAHGVAASGYNFSRLKVVVAGSPSHGRVAVAGDGVNTPDVSLSADVALGAEVLVRNLALGLKRGAKALTASIASLRVGNGSIAASGIAVAGAGEPLQGSFNTAPGFLVVKATSAGLDLNTLAYLAGQERKSLGGRIALDVDIEARRDHAKGKVTVDVTKGEWSTVHRGEAHVDLDLDGRHLTGQLHTALGDVGLLDLRDMDVHIGGEGPLDATSWRDAWGKVAVSADVDLARLAAVAPEGSLHLADLAGHLTLEGHIARDSLADVTPEIQLFFRTEGLTASGEATPPVRKPGGPLMTGPATWRLNGMDLGADLLVDGEDGSGELAFRVVDKLGGLVALDVKTAPLPFGEVLGRGTGENLADLLEELPVSILVDVPRREIGKLPLLIRPDGVMGGIEATLEMHGNALGPRLQLSVQSHSLALSAVPHTPIDGIVTAAYDGSVGKVQIDLHSPTDPLLKGDAEVQAKVKDLLAEGAAALPWKASAKATLGRFPLGAIAVLSDDQVEGLVSGEISLTGLREHAQAKVNLALDDLKVGKAKFSKGTVAVLLDDDHGLDAKARLECPSGFLEANAKMGMKWGADLAPTSDGTSLQVTLRAKHFSASAVAPFVASSISKLSGWIDADATVSLAPDHKPSMSGSVALSDGIIQAPSIGEEFHGVKGKVTLAPNGTVTLADVEARGLSGRLTASGSAHVDGTTLLGADLTLNIRKREGIPLDVQGSNLGSVYGNVNVKATGSPDGKTIQVAVNVPNFHVDLPDATFPRSPQTLADAPSVHMGVYRNSDRFIVLPMDGAPVKVVAMRNLAVQPLPSRGEVTAPALMSPPAGLAEDAKDAPPSTALDVTVRLGDVQILRGQQLAIDLDGSVNAKIAAATLVRGEIRLKSGKLNVQSKEFTIEKGTVSFVGDDPANPEVNVTAGWTAPDGTLVYVDYVGPVKTGKVTFRSEPPRPKNEILALILFGTADGSSATPYASKSAGTDTQVGTTVGGLATDGLSKGLDQITGMNVTTKIDTSDSANPRPEVEMQVAKDISLELVFVLGTPPPGTNPDTSYATINWRFVRNWSLETTFGDYGSTFADLVWKYRY
jgi:translocation and assembly module TamB